MTKLFSIHPATAAAVISSLFLLNTVAFATDYGQALDKTLLFFEAQRSGKLPATNRIKWRGDSGLQDGHQQGVDLVGGYYDAGDHVKFGLPMAFTVTMMAWGAIDFAKDMKSTSQMGNTMRAIRWGTDYFLKAHTQPNVLWAQVGDGESDHYCWERAEDMTTSRTSYKVDENHPGSDIAGETAAAFAASSIAFKRYDSKYSDLLLSHAKQLFSFADRHRGLYTDSIPNAKQFYTSSGYSDELLWAAAWLYRATGDEYYLKYVVENAASMGGTGWGVKEFSWDNKYAGVQILLSKILLEGKAGQYTETLKQYQSKADYFACACIGKNDGSNIRKTPGGLMYVREWNNMQYVSAASFLTAVYSQYLTGSNAKVTCPGGQVEPRELFDFAKSQADYILGKNPKSTSYLVGYGSKYSNHVHHRGASITSIFLLRAPVQCVEGYDTWYRKSDPNPNVIQGALVGGPDQNDNFSDDRSQYEQTEPTLTGNAPLVGLFAMLQSSSRNSALSVEKPTPAAPNTASVTGSQVPVRFVHAISKSWRVGATRYYRHKVTMKNTSQKPINGMKLLAQNLSGPLWGLTPTPEKDTYELPEWHKVLQPGSEINFVYVQGGPQAKFSVLSYH
ncbi:Endoglucanase 5 [Linum grandiflorum]